MKLKVFVKDGGFIDLPNVEKVVVKDEKAELTVYHPWSIYMMRPYKGHVFFSYYPNSLELSFFAWEEGGENRLVIKVPEFKVKGGDSGGAP